MKLTINPRPVVGFFVGGSGGRFGNEEF